MLSKGTPSQKPPAKKVKKVGDKIVQMLSKGTPSQKPPAKKVVTFNKNAETITQKEINQTLNNLLSGGSTRKKKLYNY